MRQGHPSASPAVAAPAWRARHAVSAPISTLCAPAAPTAGPAPCAPHRRSLAPRLSAHRRRSLNTFGEDGTRVYAVPRTTHQYFAIRAFSRSDLGPSLAAALDVAVTCADASRRLVPTNEGGLGLHLPLYSSTQVSAMASHTHPPITPRQTPARPLAQPPVPNRARTALRPSLGHQVGERLTIHTERYDALLPNAKGERAFAYEGMGKGALIETAPLRDDDALPLGVFEWEVCAVRPMAPAELQVNASAPAAIRASAPPYRHPATAPLRLSDALPP